VNSPATTVSVASPMLATDSGRAPVAPAAGCGQGDGGEREAGQHGGAQQATPAPATRRRSEVG
jgi:hypothetical protein